MPPVGSTDYASSKTIASQNMIMNRPGTVPSSLQVGGGGIRPVTSQLNTSYEQNKSVSPYVRVLNESLDTLLNPSMRPNGGGRRMADTRPYLDQVGVQKRKSGVSRAMTPAVNVKPSGMNKSFSIK